jgi:hypothetical protein
MQCVEFSVDPADSTIRVDKDRSTLMITAAGFPETSVYFYLNGFTLLVHVCVTNIFL